MMDVITKPHWDSIWSMLAKGVPYAQTLWYFLTTSYRAKFVASLIYNLMLRYRYGESISSVKLFHILIAVACDVITYPCHNFSGGLNYPPFKSGTQWVIVPHRFMVISCSFQWFHISFNEPLARYVKLRIRMRRECRDRFPRHRRQAFPTCIAARARRTVFINGGVAIV